MTRTLRVTQFYVPIRIQVSDGTNASVANTQQVNAIIYIFFYKRQFIDRNLLNVGFRLKNKQMLRKGLKLTCKIKTGYDIV